MLRLLASFGPQQNATMQPDTNSVWSRSAATL
jgi:hypothetical protein